MPYSSVPANNILFSDAGSIAVMSSTSAQYSFACDAPFESQHWPLKAVRCARQSAGLPGVPDSGEVCRAGGKDAFV